MANRYLYRRGPFKGKRRRSRRMMKVWRRLGSRIPELQTQDTVNGATRFDNTGFYQLEFVPTVGTGYSNRIGLKATIKSILVQGTLLPGSLQTSVPQHCRILLFWDRQPNNAAPASPLPLLSLTPISLPDPQFQNRFKILWDKGFCISGVTGTSVAPSSQEMEVKYYKKCNLVTKFSASAGVIADIVSGALYLLFIGDTAPGTNTSPTMTWSTRIRFVQ